jgi:uncharacterized protein (TIGR02271 family)
VIVRHEEEASLDKARHGVGFLRARKSTKTVKVREDQAIDVEQLVQERVPVAEGDSGQIETLPDGSLSIPLYEEELVVTKRTVLRERVIVRKQIATSVQRIEAQLRREHLEIDVDDDVEVIDGQREEDGDHANRQAGPDQASS